MLLWASKFATTKIECSFEMSKKTPLRVTFILLAMVYHGTFLAGCGHFPGLNNLETISANSWPNFCFVVLIIKGKWLLTQLWSQLNFGHCSAVETCEPISILLDCFELHYIVYIHIYLFLSYTIYIYIYIYMYIYLYTYK